MSGSMPSLGFGQLGDDQVPVWEWRALLRNCPLLTPRYLALLGSHKGKVMAINAGTALSDWAEANRRSVLARYRIPPRQAPSRAKTLQKTPRAGGIRHLISKGEKTQEIALFVSRLLSLLFPQNFLILLVFCCETNMVRGQGRFRATCPVSGLHHNLLKHTMPAGCHYLRFVVYAKGGMRQMLPCNGRHCFFFSILIVDIQL